MTTTPLTRRWRTAPPAPDPALIAGLVRELRLPEPLCRLLALRGHRDATSAKAFLRPSLDDLHDPASLAGIGPALDRIRFAIDRRQTILVHGDYDVDGICAAALYTRLLRRMGARVAPFVPHRIRDGYDLGPGGIGRAAAADARLILTADCGIVAHDAVREARKAGLDVVITDHHAPGVDLPEAAAVVNPHRADCGYPNKALSGTGVAFKVMHALARSRGLADEEVYYHLDLVALATVADVMPLTGENRVMTRFGLRVLAGTRNPGLRALVGSAGLADRALTAGHLSHALAPRLNAVGRLEDAGTGLDLLLAEAAATAPLVAELERTNARRQAVDRAILDEAVRLLDGGYDAGRDRAVVLAGRGWHPGVIGIVASRLVERVHRPTVLIALPDGDGTARGSARSIPGFDLLDSIRACGTHLERFGGHAAAAGFDIRPDRIDGFRAAFGERARALLPDEPHPELRVDLEIPLAQATPALARFLAHAGPFGPGNPTPVFVARGVRARAARVVGADGRHLRLTLADGDARLQGIAFRMAESHGHLARSGAPLDAAFHLQEDSWNGRTRLQARLVDLRPAE
ncbi:MAG TPA: single-stranded-DNA-specific exonuclease RecJ [Longimicrobiales bacterium]|nr:single-stranded-DNA-specific exonuclease RecJ [Longimicrobiales bacterium]